jgi:nucleotide-binding universal stress UspA family protein
MLRTRRRSASPPAPAHHDRSRPVLLATIDVPFDPEATVAAVDAAIESGYGLIVANVVELPPLPLSVVMGYDQLEYTPEMDQSLRAPAELAASFGVPVERLRVRSPRPVEALLQVARERAPGLLVFGPDRTRLSKRRYVRAARALRDGAPCLIWLAPNGD